MNVNVRIYVGSSMYKNIDIINNMHMSISIDIGIHICIHIDIGNNINMNINCIVSIGASLVSFFLRLLVFNRSAHSAGPITDNIASDRCFVVRQFSRLGWPGLFVA